MCNFKNLDGTSWVEHAIQIFFLACACLVDHLGVVISTLLIGFFPIYIFLFYRYKINTNFKGPKFYLSLVVAVLSTLLICGGLWISAAIMGQWGVGLSIFFIATQ